MRPKKEKKYVLFPKYWATRTIVFSIIGLVPLLSGIMFLIMGLETNEKVYESNVYHINAFEVQRDYGQNDFEIVLEIEGQIIRDTLKYHDDWYNLLGVYGNPGIRQRVLNNENIEFAINKIKMEKSSITIYLNQQNMTLTGLTIDGNTIITHYNFLLMGILFTALGIFMVGGSLFIIIKDPNNWYRDTNYNSYKKKV